MTTNDASPWALDLPDDLRVAQMLLYTAPDGGWWMAPLGTPTPDPDRAIGRAWIPIQRKAAAR